MLETDMCEFSPNVLIKSHLGGLSKCEEGGFQRAFLLKVICSLSHMGDYEIKVKEKLMG
jgi:hypothetical protein